MDTTDRRAMWTAGLAGTVVALAAIVTLVAGVAAHCW